ncbi:hypothetical protein HZA55_04025 [Candidatus Poribacteria bacterium]|nr:hypothetical protein [Candidatus Poribacteria bacterium]
MGLASKDTEKFLKDVDEAYSFWVVTGDRLKNLEELADTLEKISEDEFACHVNNVKNDFCNWIRDCIGDVLLVENLINVKTKNEAVKKVKERVKQLHDVKKNKTIEEKTIEPKKVAVKKTSTVKSSTAAKKKK